MRIQRTFPTPRRTSRVSHPPFKHDRFCSILTYKESNLFQPSHIIPLFYPNLQRPAPVLSLHSHTSTCSIPAFTNQDPFYPCIHTPAPVLSLHSHASTCSIPAFTHGEEQPHHHQSKYKFPNSSYSIYLYEHNELAAKLCVSKQVNFRKFEDLIYRSFNVLYVYCVFR